VILAGGALTYYRIKKRDQEREDNEWQRERQAVTKREEVPAL
jgi:hypothetical protein